MNRNFIRKSHKKKLISTFPQKNPEQLAQLHLIEISDQANMRDYNISSESPQQFLKIDTHQLPQKKPAKTLRYSPKKPEKHFTPQRQFVSMNNSYSPCKHKSSSFFNESQKKIIFNQAYIIRKNPIQLINLFALGATSQQKKRLFSASDNNRHQYPSSIRRLLRKKSSGTHGFRLSKIIESEGKIQQSLNSNRITFSTAFKAY